MAPKSARLVRKTVVLMTLANDNFSWLRIILTFSRTRSVCSPTSPLINCPLAGTSGICPAQNSKSPTRTAWLYGPAAGAAALGLMTVFVIAAHYARAGTRSNLFAGGVQNPLLSGEGNVGCQSIVIEARV